MAQPVDSGFETQHNVTFANGLPRGWGADPPGFSLSFPPPTVRLAPGTYKVTAAIVPQYVRLLHITAADATASVKLTVVKARGCCAAVAPTTAAAAPGRLPRCPASRTWRARPRPRCRTWCRYRRGASARCTTGPGGTC